jgi:di/tricarboxylate transporter
MTLEIALVFAVILLALIIFALELFSVDFVAFGIMALLLALASAGLIPIELPDVLSGFSNAATITVLAMFILSGGIYRCGVIHLLARRISRLAGDQEIRQLLTLMLIVGPISAFINNTAAVAILIPMVIGLAREKKRASSKMLIPLSYTSQLAGVVTLIGTSSNILASSMAQKLGLEPFGMFEFSKIGLLILGTGALYLLLMGRHLLPTDRLEAEITESYQVKSFLTEVVVLQNSPLVGQKVAESHLREEFDIDILGIIRNRRKLSYPIGGWILQAGDILFVRANTEQLLKIKDAKGLAIEPEVRLGDQELRSDEIGLMEVVISPRSGLIGGNLVETNFRSRYGCTVLAIRKHGAIIRERLHRVRLSFGDSLLLQGHKDALERLKRDPDFIVTEELQQESFRKEKIPIAVGIVAGVVLVAALGIQPILVTAIEGCVLMVLTGCLKITELHESIRWDVIFLLAGVIPLGIALEKTGGAQLLADLAAQSANYVSPLVVLWIFYFLSMLLTELISNNATVVLLVPVGAATAQTLGLDPRAFILAIMFAASTSFSTPVGYQTNTMVYGPGGYKFLDFTRVGGPLNLLLWLLTPLYIYWLWGL